MATENLSLLYYAFAAWLLEQLQDGGYRRVYFAARDGWIMKRFFDRVAAAAGFAIDSRYLYISRAALYPSLIVTDPATARQLFCRNWDHLTIKEALRRVALTYDEARVLLAKHGLANPQLRLDNKTATQFLAFLTEIWPLVERKNSGKYQHIVDYLRQEMVLTPEKAAFVDIGWHGSLQNCLVKFLNHLDIDKDLSGYYLGTLAKPIGAEPNFKARGFLVDDEEPRWIAELVRTGPSLLELFHSAGHGTVLGYQRQGARILPVLEENAAEREQFVHMIEPVQELAFELVAEQLKKHAHCYRMRAPEPAVVARAALRVVYAPTVVEAAALGRLRIASDFGGRMKSITGAVEYDLTTIPGETLPDGTVPIWQPGFHMLKSAI